MLIHHFLENSAARYPDKVAVIHDSERATYQQINAQANSLSRCMLESAIEPGDRIALLLENNVDYIISYYAILKLGAVAAPLNPGLKPEGIQYLLNDLEPAAIITNYKTERLLKAIKFETINLKALIIRAPKQKWNNISFTVLKFEDAISNPSAQQPTNPINPTELSSIIYTSGSTGKPKGVMLSHGNIVTNTVSICQYLSLTPADIQMVILPFFYVMGKSLLNTHIAAGGAIVINNRFMYPADVVHQMIEERVTGFSGVPSTYAYLLDRSPLAACKDKIQALRYCSQAGGHMALTLKKNLRDALPGHTRIYIMYGATEASARLTYLAPEYFESKTESIGKPIPGVTVRIMDDAMQEVCTGKEGELVATGPNIMQGYWKDPWETARVLSDSGYRTGDIGYYDADGFLYVTGRKDGLLKVGGHRINPVEIEDFLMSTGMLIEVLVLGVADKFMGKKLVALAVSKDGRTDPKYLMEQCAAALPKHKLPAEIIFTRSLPKKANGKIDHGKSIELCSAERPTPK